jgi:PAS domain S-box-containing protein
MISKLKILHLEDMKNDAVLVHRELKNANIECEILLVDNKDDFINAFKNFNPDVILADHTLPFFNSLEALKTIKDAGKKIPFILVTATVSEEYAVSVMKEGADDYILKDRLTRLPNAVLNAVEKYQREAMQQNLLSEAAEQEKRINEALRQSNERYEIVAKATNDAIWDWDLATGNVFITKVGLQKVYGYGDDTELNHIDKLNSKIHPKDREKVNDTIQKVLQSKDNNTFSTEYRFQKQSGDYSYILDRGYVIRDDEGKAIRMIGAAQDITERKRVEAELQVSLEKSMTNEMLMKKAELELIESHKKYEVIIENSMNAFFLTNSDGDILDTNDAACRMFGYTKDELKKLNSKHILETNDPRFILALQHRRKTGHMRGEITGIKKSGERFLLEFNSIVYFDANGEEKISSLLTDITSRKQQEEILLKSNERFTHVTKATFDAIWDWDVQSQQLYLGDAFEELFGYHVENNIGDFSTWYNHIHPEDKERVIQSRLNKIIHRDESTWKDEYRYIRSNGSIAYISDRGVLLRNNNSTYRMIGAMQDVTELKENEIAINELNKALGKRAEELASSNEELERFAYVASHDLQEPLRMVSSFLQLLQKKYETQLDETAQKYITYAVDGADRMKTLILDLLEYSRISSYKEAHVSIDLNELVDKTLLTLKPRIDETEASVIVPPLPTVYGNKSHLTRLFQNLITNALKYRSASKPVVEIDCVEKSDEWEFSVKDNGIGIDSKYFEKIFVIFQRLHSRTEYNGTGIGLAICKKVVEMHGGKIWLESTPKVGSKFYFTISKYRIPKVTVTENSLENVA